MTDMLRKKDLIGLNIYYYYELPEKEIETEFKT